MKAVLLREHGGPEVLKMEEIPRQKPEKGEVEVKLKAVALNHLDLWVRQGIPGAPFKLPLVGGADGAGIISALGDGVKGMALGDEVMVLPGLSCGQCMTCLSGQDQLCKNYEILGESRNGTQAEYVTLPRENVILKPKNISFEEAAAMSLTFLTSWHMLVNRAELRPGELLLVQGGSSGVGVAAIQIAKFLGATVVATAGNKEKRDLALSLGASAAFDSRDKDWFRQFKAQHKEGADVIFEHIGGSLFESSLRVLGKGGRLVTCGATIGHKAEIDLRHLFFKSQSILGSTMGPKSTYEILTALMEKGHFKAVIDRVLPLADIQEGHRLLMEGKVMGKIVLSLEQ